MYADDTTLYFNLEDIDSVNLNENINIHLEKINFLLVLVLVYTEEGSLGA